MQKVKPEMVAKPKPKPATNKMKVTIVFTCDIGDQTLEETKAYLAETGNYEVLEWMPSKGVKFTIEQP